MKKYILVQTAYQIGCLNWLLLLFLELESCLSKLLFCKPEGVRCGFPKALVCTKPRSGGDIIFVLFTLPVLFKIAILFCILDNHFGEIFIRTGSTIAYSKVQSILPKKLLQAMKLFGAIIMNAPVKRMLFFIYPFESFFNDSPIFSIIV